MFETAELGRSLSKQAFKRREVQLRQALLQAQFALRKADFPVIVVFAGVDGAGKGETIKLLNEWMDPRWLKTRAFDNPSDAARERPEFWRYWRDLPAKGQVGLFLSAWYSRPVLQRVYAEIDDVEFDKKLTFEKLTDVYHSGTTHEEDQPCHLKIADYDICNNRCTQEYGNPCQHFCPASVYEMVDDEEKGNGALKLRINASNCVHCKTCDIADPYQIITWVTPEGGGGPDYKNL